MTSTLETVNGTRAGVSLRYAVRPALEEWVVPEGSVPESIPHEEAAERLRLVLAPWAERTNGSVRIAKNLAVRWLEKVPQVGIDPDVCVLDPVPPDYSELSSLCLWKPGHVAPKLCFEVVSKNHPYKDYAAIQDRYAAIATDELVVFDPGLHGPRSLGGPVLLQLWRRDELGLFERIHFSNEPAYSRILQAWLQPGARFLSISDDRQGERVWKTSEELERDARARAEAASEQANSERERAEAERERAEAERERAEAERERAREERDRERAAREDLERRLSALEQQRSGS